MGLFDKKFCDICGEKIGLLGNRKLADGNLCKTCAAKLSPWFTERKQSTVAEIREQLEQRAANQAQLSAFRPTRTIGDKQKVYIDEVNGRFIVTAAQDIIHDNPDIIDLRLVTGCDVDIDQNRSELTYANEKNEQVSYNPPRYEYRYTFWFRINLMNHPYINQIRFRLNPRDVILRSEAPRSIGFRLTMPNDVHPEYNVEYREYQQMAEELKAALTSRPQQAAASAAVPTAHAAAPVAAPAAAPADNGAWTCPSCGMSNTGKFCEGCGTPRPAAVTVCPSCGWKPEGGVMPKFCPECGNRF